ncbi:hypothetical protein HU715_026715, partial [Pseudomonas sp. SWRI12]
MRFKEKARLQRALLFIRETTKAKESNATRKPNFYPVARELAPAGLRSSPKSSGSINLIHPVPGGVCFAA